MRLSIKLHGQPIVKHCAIFQQATRILERLNFLLLHEAKII
jgi:hypothetical protein